MPRNRGGISGTICRSASRVEAVQGGAPSIESDDDRVVLGRPLPGVGVEGGSRGGVEAAVKDVADDSDDAQETEVAVHVSELDELS